MTLHSFEESMKDMDKKRVSKFIRRSALLCFILLFGIFLFAVFAIGGGIAACVPIAGVILYICMLDAASESEETFKAIEAIARFWFLAIPIAVLLIGLGVVLH